MKFLVYILFKNLIFLTDFVSNHVHLVRILFYISTQNITLIIFGFINKFFFLILQKVYFFGGVGGYVRLGGGKLVPRTPEIYINEY